jgi:hypothetical protein
MTLQGNPDPSLAHLAIEEPRAWMGTLDFLALKHELVEHAG